MHRYAPFPGPRHGSERGVKALLLACTLLACNSTPTDLREWRPSDHEHTTNPGSDQVEGGPDAGTAPELAQHGLNEVVIVTWQQNCVRCHGRLGRGDGPQGAMMRATDFTNPAWQAAVTDEQMLKSIREGKGAMPPFPLPETTLKPLVQLIRLLGRAATEPSASAAPTPSARASAGPRSSGMPAGPLPPGHPATGALPPGHPPTGTLPPGHPATGTLPPGHPPAGALPPGRAPAGSLPPGHPPTGALPPGHPPLEPAAPAGTR